MTESSGSFAWFAIRHMGCVRLRKLFELPQTWNCHFPKAGRDKGVGTSITSRLVVRPQRRSCIAIR